MDQPNEITIDQLTEMYNIQMSDYLVLERPGDVIGTYKCSVESLVRIIQNQLQNSQQGSN